MRNLIYVTAILLLTGLFYSCEKEQYAPAVSSNESTAAVLQSANDDHVQTREQQLTVQDVPTNQFMFFYDPRFGQSQIYQLNPNGNIHKNAHSTANFRSNARIVTSLHIGEQYYILVYSGGTGEIYKLDGNNRKFSHRVAIYTNWRNTWDIITSFHKDGKYYLSFYENDNGVGEIYELNLNGTLGKHVVTYNNWRKTWDKIVPIYIDNKSYLLFYERDNGVGEFYTLQSNGKLGSLVVSYNNWQRTWSEIVPVTASNNEYLLFYNRGSSLVEIYGIVPTGKLGGRTYQKFNFLGNWDLVQPFNIIEGTTSRAGVVFAGGGNAQSYNFDKTGQLFAPSPLFTGWNKHWTQMLFIHGIFIF